MRRKSLIVGCHTFLDTKFNELKSVPNDLINLYRLLSDPSIGYFDNVEKVLNPTLITFKKCLGRFIANLNSEDQALIFLSSHAEVDVKSKELCICLHDTEKSNLFTAVTFTEILNIVFSSPVKQVLILLDVCYSGQATQQHNNVVKDGKQVSILSSTQYFLQSWENKDGTGSVFLNSIIEGITTGKADFSRKGQISVTDLYSYLALNKAIKQLPSILGVSSTDFIFCKTLSTPQYDFNLDKNVFAQFNSKKMKISNLLQLKQQLHLTLVKVIANVEGGFTETNDKLEFSELCLQVQKSNNYIGLLGIGGSGKSFILRNLFTELSRIDDVLPIYYDMKYNQETDIFIYIWKLIYDIVQVGITKEDVENYLKASNTIILIDSLDEINENNKIKFIEQLNELITTCNVKTVIASRPNEILHKLPVNLMFFKVQNLKIHEIKKVLNKDFIFFLGSVDILEFASTPLSLSILQSEENKYLNERPKSKEHLILGFTHELIRTIQGDFDSSAITFNAKEELSKSAANTFFDVNQIEHLSKEVTDILRKRNLFFDTSINFPHIELQSAFASYYFANQKVEFFTRLSDDDKELILTKDVSVYISIQSQSLAEYFSDHLLEQFLNTNKSIYLIALAKIAKSGNCPTKILKKIINQIVNIYDLQEEKFYPLWEYLRPIVFTWTNDELTKALKDYLMNDGELRPIKLNVYHHSFPILEDDRLVDWLYSQYEKYYHDRHMIYSILEVMWLRKEISRKDLLKNRFISTDYPVERSAILKCLYANNDPEVYSYVTGAVIGDRSEIALREKVVGDLLRYYTDIQKDTQKDRITIDIERGHVIIELSIHNENECNKILSSINFNMPEFKKCTNTLRYHSYYASQNLSKITDFWCIQKN